jgi:hypothetical protein
MRWVRACFASLLVGCGVDVEGVLGPIDGGPMKPVDAKLTVDARRTIDAPAVDSPVVTKQGPPPPPGPCSEPPGPCVAALPAGWQLVLFETSPASPCPPPYATLDVVSNPVAAMDACVCDCQVATPASCTSGSLTRMISTGCTDVGTTVTISGERCTPLTEVITLSSSAQSGSVPPAGGTCSGSATPAANAVTTTAGRVCTPETNCEEQACKETPPPGFLECITKAGMEPTCPAGWGQPLVVGLGATASCSSCSCTDASSCTDATLTWFADDACTDALATLACDDQCDSDAAGGADALAFEYSATLNPACAVGAPSTATVSLTGPETVCCKL